MDPRRRSGEAMGFDFTDELLLLSGELDPIITIEDAEELAAALPSKLLQFHRFPGAGHLLALEQPEAVLGLIRKFVLEDQTQTAL